jgi:hypothetical protein
VLLPCTGQSTRPVHGLVDRMCVGLEEYPGNGKAILDPRCWCAQKNTVR